MIDLNDIDLLIAAFLSGKAGKEEVGRLKTWIDESPENNRYFQKSVNVWQGLHPAFNPEEINLPEAQRKVMKQIEAANTLKRVLLLWQRAAAVIAIPLLLLSLYLLHEKNANVEEEIYQELTAPYGTISHINLPDGSNVWLNSGSSLKYPVRFRDGEREVTLNGEGYFDVQSDRKNPFIVQTAQMKLIATGTQFNIEAYGTDSITAVTMVSGEINVSFNHSTPIQVRPNERAYFNDQERKVFLSRTDPYKWYAWKNGLLIFRDDPLSYVFKRLSRTFNVDIHLKDTTVANDLYRATFGDESLDEILRLLEKTAPIKFVHHKRTQTKDNLFEKQIIDVYKRGK
jgi:ferric-dicitrate binding protein FerR (iron transport regulator)